MPIWVFVLWCNKKFCFFCDELMWTTEIGINPKVKRVCECWILTRFWYSTDTWNFLWSFVENVQSFWFSAFVIVDGYRPTMSFSSHWRFMFCLTYISVTSEAISHNFESKLGLFDCVSLFEILLVDRAFIIPSKCPLWLQTESNSTGYSVEMLSPISYCQSSNGKLLFICTFLILL